MMSVDPTPRLFAAAAALTGTGILMCRAEPSWDGILIGLLCLGLWTLGTLAARPVRSARPAPAMVLEAVIVETPRARPEFLLPLSATAHPMGRAALPAPASRPPDGPRHRQRVTERHRRTRR